ncbi:MAG: hypothetical protein ACK5UP_17030 [Bacteroidota bacterium]|jgi:hypothetical protein|nr:hypothetical protein [Flammeovirgaceae bacterium]MCZ8069035.1 hypothetical protein [Cytophagales bacterium]
MKALKSSIVLKAASTVAIALVLLVSSCKKDAELLNASDTQNLNSESISDSYLDEANDVSNIAIAGVSDVQYGNARTEGDPVTNLGDIDDRLKCATVTITRSPNSNTTNPVGSIVIDFGTGCTDARGVVRKGKITINYTGRRFAPNSTIITTFQDFFRNGVKVEGTHTLTNVTSTNVSYLRFNVVIAGGKLTFPDGKTITREHNFTREWQRATNPTQDKWVILAGSSASGTNKSGKSYVMNVTKDLVYSRACQISNQVFIAVSGTKAFTVDGRVYSVDYGDGACDNTITVSLGGVSKTITVNADGN